MNRGIILSLSAYIFWGLHPIYWKLLHEVPSIEIVTHRIIWSLLFFAIIISYRKGWKEMIMKIEGSDNKIILFLPALLIGSNWSLYIWAVNAGFIVETSLGYFISPLVSVFLGVLFLKENLRKIQWLSVLIASAGVIIITFIYGQFPWISIFLAGTWATYGLLRKKSPLSSIEGLTLETALLAAPVIIYILYLTAYGGSSFIMNTSTTILLIGSGVMSGLPLLIFIMGARMISLSLIGILQYISNIITFCGSFYLW